MFNALIIENMRSTPVSMEVEIDNRLSMEFQVPANRIVRFVDYAPDANTRRITLTGNLSDGKQHFALSGNGGGVILQVQQKTVGTLIADLEPQTMIMKQPAYFELFIPNLRNVTIQAGPGSRDSGQVVK